MISCLFLRVKKWFRIKNNIVLIVVTGMDFKYLSFIFYPSVFGIGGIIFEKFLIKK